MQRNINYKDNNSNFKNISHDSTYSGCIPNIHPQQQEFSFEDFTLDSCFDSGNMGYATKHTDNHVNNSKKPWLNYSIIFGSAQIAQEQGQSHIIEPGSILE